ncbi:double zinc ribbon and ankyrin repeat-containing protein 1 [Pangasianodon hypophthalmus]|uniref:double zinc ribbon and ankyrin repeat-containing protein 1 n=1 Tax=Pangasianodon hypophthalmus TaxID=310915 RepID=UPI0023070622|nr:double zinc ribbon and ankyrin repeat-containing protein 1 [Pangasianodon hypophthalmus]
MTAGSIVAPFIIPIRIPTPGKAKHEIDTNTPIEIKSDTPDVRIFYTLDGTKPELLRRPGLGDSSTLRYTEPIRLPSGKVHVRAIAVTSDGRQSAVVTKVFVVDCVPSELQEPSDEIQEFSIKSLEQSDFEHEQVNGAGDASLDTSNNGTRRTRKGPRFLSQRLQSAPVAPPTKRPQSAGDGDGLLKNLNSTQISRLQRETDFLRCFKCLSHRPSDPFARFCLHCGAPVPPIPGQRLPPTEGGQMILCVQCKSMVPANTSSCVVCETPISPQLQPQASLKLQGKLICPSCGTGNPAHITFCVTCETRLSQADSPVLSGQRAPPLPSAEGKMVPCSKCNRVNHSDARFCDWCGAKPGHAAKYLTCSKCGASSHPYANFCGSCGVFLEGPPRGSACSTQPSARDGALEPEQISSTRHAAVASVARCVDAQTQTSGLFYPSSTELQKRSQQREAELSRQGQMSDRKPLLTAISPGRGFWRKQLDHICAHLRSYTQNNSEFRALVGEPRMGRLISAVIEEDSYEVSLRVNFILESPDRSRSSPSGHLNGSLCEKLNLSEVTEGRTKLTTSQTSLVSEATVSGMSAKNRKKSCTSATAEQPPESKDSLLLREVGPQGRGQIAVVEQLLDEGADPSCLDGDERPPLVAAVLNGHHDVIPMLVQKGADADQLSGPLNNSALHEAAALGTEGLRSAEILLGCNASLRKLNNHGQTPYNVAEASGSSSMLSLLAAHRGGSGLNSRSASGLDTFS